MLFQSTSSSSHEKVFFGYKFQFDKLYLSVVCIYLKKHEMFLLANWQGDLLKRWHASFTTKRFVKNNLSYSKYAPVNQACQRKYEQCMKYSD